ncbi:MAG TPA: SCO family protein [Gemmatimonadaceae bacterium]|nr:SCO family protein [Gemmatimonadaceae bacterium]
MRYHSDDHEAPRGSRPGGRHTAIAASWLGLALALLIAGCGSGAAADRTPATGGYYGAMLSKPLAKPDFTLTDTRGQPFHFKAATQGYVTLLYFGYTNCPDVCPVHMANIAAVLKEHPDLRDHIKVVFVTTDPARDSLPQLRAWLDNFDSTFVGLRGPIDEVNRIQASLNLPPAEKEPGGKNGDYGVGHSAEVIAFTPDNLAHLVYPFGVRQSGWAADLPRLVHDKAWGAE